MKPCKSLLPLLLAAALGAQAALVDNAAMDADLNQDNWPDAWPAVADNPRTWETDGANRFIRLTSPRPRALVPPPRDLALPPGTPALALPRQQPTPHLASGAPAGDARVPTALSDA